MACSRSLLSRAARLASGSASERRAAASIAVLLAVVALGLRTLGMRRARAVAAGVARALPEIDSSLDARRVARLVDAVADAFTDHTFAEIRCLARSLTLLALIQRRHQSAELRLGVRKGAGNLDAHAWVVLDGEVLNDEPTVDERYVPLELSVSARERHSEPLA